MQTASRWHAFVAWYRKRPFIGGVLTVLGGIEMFFSGQLSLGDMKVQVGIEGFQATLIPIVLVLVGVLATLMPQHRIFYGVIALVVAVYSLVGVNLGGFFVGMILASVGGVMIVSWMPRHAATAEAEGRAESDDDPADRDSVTDKADHDSDGETDDQTSASADAIAALVPPSDDDLPPVPDAFDDSAPVATASPARAAAPAASVRRRGSRSTGKGVGRSTAGGALAIALTVTVGVGLTTGQPQRAAAAEATGVCILGFIGDCSTPSPTPTPSSTGTPAPLGTATDPSSGGATGAGTGGGTGGGTSTPAVPAGPQLIAPASASPVFTGKPALLQGSSLAFSGLRYLGLATVRLSDGSTATVLKLSMDSVTIPGFRLDTRDADGEGTDTVATQMAFSGGVDTYCSSLKGILQNGAAVQYDISHPPSTDGSVPVTRIISLEVFGITGGSSALTGFHEIIS
ncbi:hypothetical protein HII28_05495 [Planctomonas sp. JC2975]|uniref:DUF6114 domain-containing protein n=1 Tax=Planctomonas sp. JC2975 TaxID=2729626 RepID=UPI001474D587|nr:hypothetical protein [Planctomonas sp. JC2975]